MAQWVKTYAAKPEDMSVIRWWKERIDTHKLSSSSTQSPWHVLICGNVPIHMHPPHTHTHTYFGYKLTVYFVLGYQNQTRPQGISVCE